MTATPPLTLAFQVIAILQTVGGLMLWHAWWPGGLLPSWLWFVAGLTSSLLFLALGAVLQYLHDIRDSLTAGRATEGESADAGGLQSSLARGTLFETP